MSELDDLFTRAGHPSELSLARYANGELDEPERRAIEQALADDPQARAILAELQTCELAAPAPTATTATQASAAKAPIELASRRRGLAPWLGVLALAAAAGFVAWLIGRPSAPSASPQAPTIASADTTSTTGHDDTRIKGDEFAFELWIDDGERSFRAHEGDEVHAGDALAFRVYPREAGSLLIVCIDPRGRAQACYPREGFAAIEARGDALTIDPGLAFDAAPGEERFVALLCDEAPPREQVLADPDAAWPTCTSEALAVRKASAP